MSNTTPSPVMDSVKQIAKRSQRHLLVLCFVGAVFALFVIEAALPVWLALAGFAIVFASSLVYLEQPLPISTARRKRSVKAYSLRRDAADLLPHATLLLDTKGTIILANRAALDLFNAKSSDDDLLRGSHLSAVLREPRILEAFEECVKSGESRQVKWTIPVPAPRYFNITLSPALTPRHEAKPFVIISLDDQTNIHLAEQMRSDFIANASHELKTPLSVFTGYLEALPEIDDKEQRNKFIRILEAESKRMVQLVEDLLSLSRIEQTAHLLPEEKISLPSIIAEAIEINQSIADKLEMKIKFDPSNVKDNCIVRSSQRELSHAFNNLIHNALTHSASAKEKEIEINIHASTLNGQSAWRVDVKDYGSGIAAHHIPRLTERFYRINPAESRKLGGTGLGLAIVKHILTRHHGALEIQSKLGEGSTFSVILPQLE